MHTKITAAELTVRLGSWMRGDTALYQELAHAIEVLIRDGHLAPGTRLPAERVLARQLAVSRGTVMSAYEQLRASGTVRTVHGSGTVVLREASPVSGPREAHLTTALPHESLMTWGAAGPATWGVEADADAIDMRGAYWVGTDGLTHLRTERIQDHLAQVAHHHGYEAFGLASLRETVAAHIGAQGLATSPDQILITTGAQQAISLTAQLYVGTGDTVVVEEPTYVGAYEAMVAQQAEVVRVPVGEAGVELTALRAIVERHHPRLAYLTPSVHNPTGTVMPGAARQRLAELLAGWDTIVLDDTTLLDTQWIGEVPAPLAAFADPRTEQRIVTVGSLSKSVWAGLRIGWVRAHATTISRLARLKSIADVASPIFSQLMAQELLSAPATVLAPRRAELRARQELFSELLRGQLPDWRWSQPRGGMCLWIDLGAHDAAAFARTSARHGVSILPPATSSATDQAPHRLRLPYGQPPEVLTEAVARLAAAWQVHLRSHPPIPGGRADDATDVAMPA